jgi:PKD repeat protein
MKKIIYTLSLIALAIGNTVFAQDWKCGSNEAEERIMHINADYLLQNQEFIRWRDSLMPIIKAQKSNYPLAVIPIVFHIVHENGTENISRAQVMDALNILNNDFKKLNSDTSNVIAVFKPIIGNANVEFRLPTIDPTGNCTDGIIRHESFKTNSADDASKLTPWPRHKYFNVWVVKSIGSQGVAGYAYKPASVNNTFGAQIDGVIILHDYVGSIGTGSPGRSRALTHELGHSLSLDHTWGGTNNPGVACGDDGFPDTPVTKGWTNCSNPNGSVCNPPIVENVQNFMEYSYCSRMYTEDQAAAIRTALSNSASDRDKLWQASNLTATGTDLTSAPVCTPVADFIANRRFVCVGDAVTFTDKSWRGIPTSYSWTFQDGTPANATSASVSVTFNSSGWKNVTLQVSNAAGNDAKFVSQYIYVSAGSTAGLNNFWESFEDTQSDYNWWLFDSPISNASKFEVVSGAGFTGNRSVRINSYDPAQMTPPFNSTKKSERDYFYTPPVNLQTASGNRIAFRYSCATQATQIANMNDILNVHASKDCGKTWVLVGKIDKVDIITAGQASNYFTPSNSTQWKLKSFNIPSSVISSNTMFRFEYINGGYSNNLYIDDIQVAVAASIEEALIEDNVKIYPNPVAVGNSIIIETNDIIVESLQLIDVTGKTVYTTTENKHELITINTQNLNSGIYIVIINSDKGMLKKKIVVNK